MRKTDGVIAYFSMEIGLDSAMPTYSGGLGILAGDTLRSAADLGLPVVGVSLLYREGYFHQTLTDGGQQQEEPVRWNPEDFLTPVNVTASCEIAGRTVRARAWRYDLRSLGGTVPIYFLDTDLADNDPEDRKLSTRLYGGDDRYRLAQEIVLGIGGVNFLAQLGHPPEEESREGFRSPCRVYHMNEGHAALLNLALLDHRLGKQERWQFEDSDLSWLKARTVFTTHTPVPAGHDRFDRQLVGEMLPDSMETLGALRVFEEDKLNMTHLALRGAGFINGVARRHAEVSRDMFGDLPFSAPNVVGITNGVHAGKWTAAPMRALFDKYVPGWELDNSYLREAVTIPLEEIRLARQASRQMLFAELSEAGHTFDESALTIGFARRAAEYKRADLVFHDLDRLAELGKRFALQFVFAGKAHPRDLGGKLLIERVVSAAKRVGGAVRVAYLPNYDMRLGALITSGVDLWLNNPLKPLEASGTSGMKAAINGVPSLSTLDGWWVEGCFDGVTGWEIPDHADAFAGADSDDRSAAESLYQRLEEIAELYYHEPDRFTAIQRQAIAINGSYFNTQRMVEQYQRHAYAVVRKWAL